MRFIIAALNLLCVLIFGFAKVPVTDSGPLLKPVRLYCAFSGACVTYGYFAPGIGTDARASIDIHFPDGQKKTLTLGRGGSQETDTKRGLLGFYFLGMFDQVEVRQSLAASWARRMFLLHPTAQAVEVTVQALDIPTIAEFQKGKRQQWIAVYQAQFTHSSP